MSHTYPQQQLAAAASARARVTRKIISAITTARPLTAEQRAAIIDAAQGIDTVGGAK